MKPLADFYTPNGSAKLLYCIFKLSSTELDDMSPSEYVFACLITRGVGQSIIFCFTVQAKSYIRLDVYDVTWET